MVSDYQPSANPPFNNFQAKKGACTNDAPLNQEVVTVDSMYGVSYKEH